MNIKRQSAKESNLFYEIGASIQRAVHSTPSEQINGLAGSAAALYFAQAFTIKDEPLVVVLNNNEQIDEIAAQIQFFNPRVEIYHYPAYDVLPYDNLSPNPAQVYKRRQFLSALSQNSRGIYLIAISAALEKTIAANALSEHFVKFSTGQQINRKELQAIIHRLGYSLVDSVLTYGEYSLRGERFDIFSAPYENPLRFEFFDDEIEAIKEFDVESQTSIGSSLNAVEINAVSAVILSTENIARAEARLSEILDEQAVAGKEKLLQDMSTGTYFSALHRMLPLYSELTPINSYFNSNQRILLLEPSSLKNYAAYFADEYAREYLISREQNWLTLENKEIYQDYNSFVSALNKLNSAPVFVGANDDGSSPFARDNFVFNSYKAGTAAKLEVVVQATLDNLATGASMLIVCHNQTNLERIKDIFDAKVHSPQACYLEGGWAQFVENAEKPGLYLLQGNLKHGFRWFSSDGALKFGIYTDHDFFAAQPKSSKKRSKKPEIVLESLKPGDFVVHEDYGIARFESMVHLDNQHYNSDCVVLQFAGNDKIYLPIDSLHLIEKYSGVDNHSPRVNKLSDNEWNSTKRKVTKSVHEIASELVELYAARKALLGTAFTAGEEEVAEFRRGFLFDETADQLQAIEDVLNDLSSDKPMERLICGDAGFGKTEVAMRACVKVLAHGYQVALVAPTTILAEQHFNTFKRRFSKLPYKLAMFSRFQTPAQNKEAVLGLKSGEISIVIGTHRLFSKDVVFNKLGLLIIDEEHRFGVKQKETLRLKHPNVDSLSMSATPIPRSLQLSLSGIRDISLITTPPLNRREIRTRVLSYSPLLIQEVIMREVRRGGQVYFIHNRVETIIKIQQDLQELLPDVSFRIAHGQLSKNALEDVMTDFVKGRFTVLIATSIVESGLDIPNANTIIINNADKLGLAQLYQLRGRVGRSAVQAYACFLVQGDRLLSLEAEKRVNAIAEFSQLGSGFKIASHDLAIRGAGNFLGESQSGYISTVGIGLYMQLLNEAVAKLKDGASVPETSTKGVKLSLGFDSYLPESYIESAALRLEIYREIAACQTEEETWRIKSSLEDRFGLLPDPALSLIDGVNAKIWAAKLMADGVDIAPDSLVLHLSDRLKPDIVKLMQFLSKNRGKLTPPKKIVFKLESGSAKTAASLLKSFYLYLS